MDVTCFVYGGSGAKLSLRRPRAVCGRRLQVPFSCAKPVGPGDDSWLDMARALGNDEDEKDPVRPAPQWEYPEGDNFSTPTEYTAVDRLESPWETWSAALERDRAAGEPAARDPAAEVNFWRNSARDIVDNIGVEGEAHPERKSAKKNESQASPSAPSAASPIPSDPRELWGEASRITGSVADLQTQLWDELERFDSNDGNTPYRDLARELRSGNAVDDNSGSPSLSDIPDSAVTPSKSDAQDPAGLDSDGATTGSGWNPDVDWRRFDDVAREEQSRNASFARNRASADAETEREGGFGENSVLGGDSDEVSSVTYTDADGRILSAAEVKAAVAEGAIFVDEDGNDLSAENYGFSTAASEEPPPNSTGLEGETMPRSGTDRAVYDEADRPNPVARSEFATSSAFGSRGTPAPVAGGKKTQDLGSSRDFWRSAAREVTTAETVNSFLDSDKDLTTGSPGSEGLETREAVLESTQGTADARGVEKSSVVIPYEAVSDSSDVWTQWKSGQEMWKKAVESAPERDAKAEVDMWRDTARAVVSDTPGNPRGRSEVENTATEGTSGSDDNPWSAWSAANSSWEQSLDVVDDARLVDGASKWRDTAENLSPKFVSNPDEEVPAEHSSTSLTSDWGAPLSAEPMRTGNAWSSWQGEDSSGLGRSAWWNSRQDIPKKRSVTAPSDIDASANLWRSAARDLAADGNVTDGNGLVNDGTSTEGAHYTRRITVDSQERMLLGRLQARETDRACQTRRVLLATKRRNFSAHVVASRLRKDPGNRSDMISTPLTLPKHATDIDSRLPSLQVQDHPHDLNFLLPIIPSLSPGSTAGQSDCPQSQSAIDSAGEFLPLSAASKQQPTTAGSLPQDGQGPRRHHGNVCETCDKAFERLYNLKVHRRKHNGDRPYSCPMHLCEKKFRWRSSMAHHVKAHHGGSSEDINRACKRADHPKRKVGESPSSSTRKQRTDGKTKRQVFPRPPRSEKTQKSLCPTHPYADVSVVSRQDYFPMTEAMSAMAPDGWGPGMPGMAPSDCEFDDTIFSFLAQSDANVTDAEMISISSNSNKYQ